jgi:hypothetical protein
MNFGEVIKGAWHNVRIYRALWVFGIILALFTSSWETAALLGGDDQSNAPSGIQITRLPGETFGEAFRRTLDRELDQAGRDLDEFLSQELDLDVGRDIVALITALLSVALILYLLGRVARYVSETALIRMVDRHQETGQRQTARQGLRLGWSRCAWRLFLIELTVNLVAIAGSLLLFALIFSTVPLWSRGSEPTVVVGAIITAALFFLGVFLVVLIVAAVSLVKIFSRRACAIEGLGVTASVYRGFSLVKGNLRPLVLPALIMLGINLGWPLLGGVLVLVLLGIGILVGGLPALMVRWLAGLATGATTAVVIAVVVGVLLLILVLAAPLIWLDGMRQVFLSSMWTLSYRELCRLEQLAQEVPPDIPLPAPPAGSPGASNRGAPLPSR